MTKKQDTQPPGSGSPRRRPRKKAGPRRPRAAEIQTVEQALAALDRLAGEALRRVQRTAPEASLDSVQVPLLLSVSGRDRAARAAELADLLQREMLESARAAAAFERGRVYCLRCENSICEHAAPPSPRHVFQGYGQTGRPEWNLLDRWLAERGDPRLSRLYEERDGLLTLAVSHDDVYGRLLPGFEESRRRFLILAQLCAGYFRPEGASRDSESMALTVQVVRSLRTTGEAIVGVNLIGQVPEDHGLPQALDDQILEGLSEALDPLRRELRPFSGRKAPPGTGIALERLTRRCLTLIREACRDLEHRRRGDLRRTRHARERGQQGDRPTAKAFEDARSAADHRCFEDRQERTFVVLGGRGRVHVFTPEGKHVTSAVYSGQEIRQRTGQKRWVPLTRKLLAGFRERIQGSAS